MAGVAAGGGGGYHREGGHGVVRGVGGVRGVGRVLHRHHVMTTLLITRASKVRNHGEGPIHYDLCVGIPILHLLTVG